MKCPGIPRRRFASHSFGRRSVFLFLLLIAFGCRSTSELITRPAIVAQIPNGTSASDATLQMESWGYECQFQSAGRFVALDEKGSNVTHDSINFVRCSKAVRDGLVTTAHSVAIVLDDNDQVSDVLERWDYVGP